MKTRKNDYSQRTRPSVDDIDVRTEIAAACRRRDAEYEALFRWALDSLATRCKSLWRELRAWSQWAVRP